MTSWFGTVLVGSGLMINSLLDFIINSLGTIRALARDYIFGWDGSGPFGSNDE